MEKQADLIAALATPEAVSAISLVRLSGRGASKTVERLMNLLPGKLNGSRRAVGDFAGIDYLVAVSWAEGKSYTGEEMVDLMCHGSPGTAKSVLEKLERSGARIAMPGEFTRRAWMNGRLTALDILSLSEKYKGRNQKPGQNNLKGELTELTSEIEALIEFSEDHEIAGEDMVKTLLREAWQKAEELTVRVKRAEVMPRVFLMGPVNAGKSTMFNLITGMENAVVSEIPGTTRDGAVRTVNIMGRNIEICDTAGTGGQCLDGKALEIVYSNLRKGDRIVWLDPCCQTPPQHILSNHEVLTVCSRSDEKVQNQAGGWFPVSAVTGAGMQRIMEFMIETEENSPSWRLERISNLLQEAIGAAESNDVALAAEIVEEVLRETESPERCGDAVERALERFCVGK